MYVWLCIRLNNAGKWACDRLTEDADFGKKNHLFISFWSSFWSWRVWKQVKLCIWGTENPHTYIKKPTHPKRVTVWGGFWSRGIIGPFFLQDEQGDAVTVNGSRYRAMLNEFLFTQIKEEDGAPCHTAEATLDVLRPVFEDRIITAAELMSFGHFGAAVWHRWTIICGCYADKTIDALKDNIRETIGEIQLHTIDNVLKNWTDREGYCMASRGNHLNEIIFHY